MATAVSDLHAALDALLAHDMISAAEYLRVGQEALTIVVEQGKVNLTTGEISSDD